MPSANLTGANLSNDQLGGTDLRYATLTNANLSHAILENAKLNFATLINADCRGTWLPGAKLSYANLSDADLRGAMAVELASATTHNTILPAGTINGLSLNAAETLTVRNSNIAIHVTGAPTFDPAGAILVVFDGDPWGSTISFDPGTSLTLSGDLILSVAAGLDIDSLVGESFKLFDWTNLSGLSGAFNIEGDPRWNISQLYTTGTVTFTPEPGSLVLLGTGALSLLAYAWRRRRS
jgi:hypothetical protein